MNADLENLARLTHEQILAQDVKDFLRQVNAPQDCSCKVLKYRHSHSGLIIGVYEPLTKKDYYLAFGAVEYFEGPMVWRDATIELKSYEEGMKLLEWVARYRNIPVDSFQGQAALFTFGTSTIITKILGWIFAASDKPPK
jgi:hypothetical protein